MGASETTSSAKFHNRYSSDAFSHCFCAKPKSNRCTRPTPEHLLVHFHGVTVALLFLSLQTLHELPCRLHSALID